MDIRIVTPGDISKAMLQQLYSDAYFQVERDRDDDLMIRETYKGWAFPSDDGREIRLYSQFRTNPNAGLVEKLAYCNMINDDLKMIRAYVTGSGGVGFDYHIPVDGGITRQGIVLATKRFFAILNTAISKDTKDVLA